MLKHTCKLIFMKIRFLLSTTCTSVRISLSRLTEYHLPCRGIGRCFAISGRSCAPREANKKMLINIHERHNFESADLQEHCRWLLSSEFFLCRGMSRRVAKNSKGGLCPWSPSSDTYAVVALPIEA